MSVMGTIALLPLVSVMSLTQLPFFTVSDFVLVFAKRCVTLVYTETHCPFVTRTHRWLLDPAGLAQVTRII